MRMDEPVAPASSSTLHLWRGSAHGGSSPHHALASSASARWGDMIELLNWGTAHPWLFTLWLFLSVYAIAAFTPLYVRINLIKKDD